MSNLKHLLLFCLLAFVPVSNADVWAEREALSSIRTELAALEVLVMSAKARSNSNERTQFEYETLLADLRKIQAGIAHHLTVPMEPIIPSAIDALSESYTEHQ
ncbi:integrative conjugative element protein, RAQPRD family [Marinobacter shengliensis]|uniref:integrative conjugative element protein, RAQPRD family n=1 Tax=Marinobacter shengliensis TaxID=1389223 RepID=UPI0011088B01|nr:RAQPRD family integrative conjugative element protein [Marinobacter shengliensis]